MKIWAENAELMGRWDKHTTFN